MIFGVLGRYFAARFFRTLFSVFAGVFALIYTVDMIETLRRAGESPNANAALLAWLSLLRTPIIAEQALPFAALIGSLIAFFSLSRRLELVVARASGVSAWQFLAPALLVAVLIGVIEVTAYNPLSTAMQQRADAIEAKLFGAPTRRSGGVWLNQASIDGQSIVHAGGRDAEGAFVRLQAFNFDPDGTFSQRVDAERAFLRDGFWELRNATVVTPGFDSQVSEVFLLATPLTEAQAAQALTAPETVDFWTLPALVRQVDLAGLDSVAYRLRYQQLLSTPVMLVAMVLLASCFSLGLFRMGGIQKMIFGGVGAGFVLYVATKVVGDLGGVGMLSPLAAGWLPAIVGCLIGVFVLLHQEDG